MSSDRVYSRLRDIVDNADWIADDIAGVSVEQFPADRRRADAVERCLQRITDAVIQLGTEDLSAVGLDVPLAGLRSPGNRLRHGYRRIDRRIIYGIAAGDVPALRKAAARAIAA